MPIFGTYDSSMLSWGDVLVDSHTSPTLLVVRLRHSKTDVFGTGVSLNVRATGSPICPVAVVLAYMSICPPQPGPFIMERDGQPLSWPALVAGIRRALVSAGVDVSRFSGHSFRIGAATTAARGGLLDSLIQTLGWWRSSAFLAYIRTQPADPDITSVLLVQSPCSTPGHSRHSSPPPGSMVCPVCPALVWSASSSRANLFCFNCLVSIVSCLGVW